jgi:O-antigen/teichoic acid export membrane protein
MSISKHIAANLTGSAVPLVLALATIPTYVRTVGEERFGVLALIWAVLNYFGFLDLGFGRAVAQKLAQLGGADPQQDNELVWTGLATAFAMGLVGGGAIYFAALHLVHGVPLLSPTVHAEALSAVPWLIPAFPLLLPGTVLIGTLQARLKFVELNAVQIAGGILLQVLPLALALHGWVELSVLVPAILATRLVTNLALFVLCRRAVPMGGPRLPSRDHLRHLLVYGGWISVMNILAPLLATIDRVVIATLSGARTVTHYTIPYDLVSRGMVISGSFASALFPRLAKLPIEEGRELALRSAAMLVALMSPIVALGLALAEPFLMLWVGGPLTLLTHRVAEILLLGVWINCLVIPHHSRYMATEGPKVVTLIYLVEIPIYFAMLWTGTLRWGGGGAAVGRTMRIALDTALLLRLNRVLRPALAGALPALALVGGAFTLCSLTVPSWYRFGATVIMIAVYGCIDNKPYLQVAQTLRRGRQSAHGGTA